MGQIIIFPYRHMITILARKARPESTKVHGLEVTDTGLGRSCPIQALEERQLEGHHSDMSFTESTVH